MRGGNEAADTSKRGIAAAATVAAGALAAVLANPPHEQGWLALVMLAPVVAALDGERPRRAFALVYAWAAGFALVSGRWMIHALVVQYGLAPLAAWTVLGGVILPLALLPAAAAAGYAALRPRLADAAAPVAFASLYALFEWLRAEPIGFPWLLTAQPLARLPIAIQSAELGGTHAVGFAAALANAGLGVALRWRRLAPLALPALVVAAAAGFGALALARHPAPGPRVRVGVVQASVPQEQRFQPGSAFRNVARHAAATQALARREALDLVVWSETAIDVDLDRTPALGGALTELATTAGVPIVTGAPRTSGGHHTNSVVLFAPGAGLVESYAKQRLVPFSEYDPPLAGLLAPLLGPVMEGDPYLAGREATVFRKGPLPFSTPVCFEITYPHEVRRFRDAGAALLVNLSNDAWFGPTGYPEMHLVRAIFRAVETRVWVVRGANTGISAVIDPAGRVVAELPAFEEGTFAADVGPAAPASLYARAGDVPVLAVLVLALLGALGASGRRGAEG